MSRMVRKQVYLEPRQEISLRRRAEELGISQAELLRRCIDGIGMSSSAMPRDVTAWEEAKAYIEDRMNIEAPQTSRTWTRDELYDERLKRISD